MGTHRWRILAGRVMIADRLLVPVPLSQADIQSTQRFCGLSTGRRQQARDSGFKSCWDNDRRGMCEVGGCCSAGIAAGIRHLPRFAAKRIVTGAFSEGLAFEQELRGSGRVTPGGRFVRHRS